MIDRRLPLIAVFLLAVPAAKVLTDVVTVKFNETISEISLTLFNETIVIIDGMQNGFTCEWGEHGCYVECAHGNMTLNFSGTVNLSEDEISEYEGSNAFNITDGLLECEITKCLPDPFNALLKTTRYRQLEGHKDLKRVLNMKNMCNILFKITQVKRVYIGVERLLIKVLLGIPYDGEEIIYDLTDLAVKVTKANLSSLNQNKDYIDIDAPLLFHKDRAPQTSIPAKILQNISEEERKVAVVSYKSPDQFLFSEERPQSMLIRIELFEDRVRKLENPLLMKFQISNMFIDPAVHALECQFYDEWAEDASWSKQGCDTSVTERDVLCSCDHMTPFAVLLVPAGRIDSRTWKILSVISYIGSGLSVFFTAISIMTYIIIRNPSRDHSNTIHVSLSSALFLLNVSFLLNEWLASMNIMPLCLFVGVLMHYGLLCSFTWMAIEALHLYLLIIRVFNAYVRRYIAKLSLIGWGVPAVIVGIAFAVKSEPNQFYGLEIITVGNFTTSLCWITEPLYFYGLNISYFALIFLFNNGILLTVSLRICQMRHFGRKTRRMTMPWRQACTVLGLTCLLGSTWGLAFLSYGEGLSIPMQYLFCIFNSLQGFFIFLWIYGTSRKAKREVKASRTVS